MKNKINCIKNILFSIGILLIFSFVLGCKSGPVKPAELDGWDKAKWGMTEKEILEAFKGEVEQKPKPIITEKFYCSLTIPKFKIESNDFRVYFQMDKDIKKLKEVEIVSIGSSSSYTTYSQLELSLTQKYGDPALKDTQKNQLGESTTKKWILPKTVIQLSYTSLGRGGLTVVFLKYYPSGSEIEKRI